jgi:hypothetical protein
MPIWYASTAVEVSFWAAFDLAGAGACVPRLNAFAGGGAQIVLGLQVFEVERELEDVLVLDVGGRGLGKG